MVDLRDDFEVDLLVQLVVFFGDDEAWLLALNRAQDALLYLFIQPAYAPVFAILLQLVFEILERLKVLSIVVNTRLFHFFDGFSDFLPSSCQLLGLLRLISGFKGDLHDLLANFWQYHGQLQLILFQHN